MNVPPILFGILALIGFAVFIIKTIGFTKGLVGWLLSGIIGFIGIALLVQFQFPNLFEGMSDFGGFMAYSGIQLGAGIPATVILQFILKPLFWLFGMAKKHPIG